jgi:Flp pilus assembly protein TadG
MNRKVDVQSGRVFKSIRRWIGSRFCQGVQERSPRRAQLFRGEDGSALVELGLVVPIFMIILTGAASFSIGLYKMQQLGGAVSTTAQQLGALSGTITNPCSQAVTTMTSTLPGWTAANLTYTVKITDGAGTLHTYGPTAGSSFTCTAGAANMGPNQPVTVTVSYAYNWLQVVQWSVFHFPALSGISATQTALME